MVGEVGATHHELGNSRVELHWSNGFQSSSRDVIVYQMGGHVAPAETRQQHRVLRAEVRQAPRAARQYAVVTSCSERRAIGEHKLDMLLQDLRIDRAVECRQRMFGCYHRDEIDGEQGEALQGRHIAKEKRQQSNHASAVEYQLRGRAERLHVDARRNGWELRSEDA